MSQKKDNKKKAATTTPKEDKVKTLEIKLTSEIRRALELIKLSDESDEDAVVRSLHESFEYSLIRNVITQIDERLEGIISSRVEEEIEEAEEFVEEPKGLPSPDDVAGAPREVEEPDFIDDAITEEITPDAPEPQMEKPEPKQEPAPEIPVPKDPEPRPQPQPVPQPRPAVPERKPEPVPAPAAARPPQMAAKADIKEPSPEVRLMKRNLEKKWLNTGDGV